MAGIYIVDTRNDSGLVRSLVIARSAQEAVASFERVGTTVEVGRIGTFEPGLEGARMTALAGMGEAVIAELLDEGDA